MKRRSPPGDDQEAAVVQTLIPGAYTGIVRGAKGATGVALIEDSDRGAFVRDSPA